MLLPGTLLFVLCLFLSAFFSSSETAFIAANPYSLEYREKKMMEKAKELIVSEISVAAASPSSKVEEKLLGTLSRCFKTAKSRAAA